MNTELSPYAVCPLTHKLITAVTLDMDLTTTISSYWSEISPCNVASLIAGREEMVSSLCFGWFSLMMWPHLWGHGRIKQPQRGSCHYHLHWDWGPHQSERVQNSKWSYARFSRTGSRESLLDVFPFLSFHLISFTYIFTKYFLLKCTINQTF